MLIFILAQGGTFSVDQKRYCLLSLKHDLAAVFVTEAVLVTSSTSR
jgi:hypothetical protein